MLRGPPRGLACVTQSGRCEDEQDRGPLLWRSSQSIRGETHRQVITMRYQSPLGETNEYTFLKSTEGETLSRVNRKGVKEDEDPAETQRGVKEIPCLLGRGGNVSRIGR